MPGSIREFAINFNAAGKCSRTLYASSYGIHLKEIYFRKSWKILILSGLRRLYVVFSLFTEEHLDSVSSLWTIFHFSPSVFLTVLLFIVCMCLKRGCWFSVCKTQYFFSTFFLKYKESRKKHTHKHTFSMLMCTNPRYLT